MRIGKRLRNKKLFYYLSNYYNSPIELTKAISLVLEYSQPFMEDCSKTEFEKIINYFQNHLIEIENILLEGLDYD